MKWGSLAVDTQQNEFGLECWFSYPLPISIVISGWHYKMIFSFWLFSRDMKILSIEILPRSVSFTVA